MLSIFQFSTCLLQALLLGAAIGVERQWRQRLAGRLTIEKGISEVSWKVTGEENDL
jgi:hypothetical protein